ncbi:MAG: DedA family protein [Deltaproteobacteria bacterium]|jgi:membrane protein DedA with SNARE-associated domain|nr:DedA family protein [Deltaproteobacteria bacterium]
MTLESVVDSYGYLAVLFGTFVEGETILVLGGFAAHRGYLALPWVIVAAFFGSLCGDQLFFFLGRRHSQAVLARRPAWKARADKANRLLERFRTPFILVFRFLYGLRSVSPFVIGMSSVPVRQFILLNAIGALAWAVVVGTGGYLFGSALEMVIGDVKRYEVEALFAIAIIGLLVWTVHLYRGRKRTTSSQSSQN